MCAMRVQNMGVPLSAMQKSCRNAAE